MPIGYAVNAMSQIPTTASNVTTAMRLRHNLILAVSVRVAMTRICRTKPKTMTQYARHGYDGPRGFWSYLPGPLIDCNTMYFTPGFLREPRDGWSFNGFYPGTLVKHLEPLRVWRLTGSFDIPYPGLLGYEGIWPD